jgi:hypothetical protein
VNSAVNKADYDRQVMDHLLHIERSLEAMALDVAEIKTSLDRVVAQCARAQAMLVQVGREIERVH